MARRYSAVSTAVYFLVALAFPLLIRLFSRLTATHLSGQVGMSSRPKVAFVTCAKATYQAATPQVMPT